jgi:hypothetical protein
MLYFTLNEKYAVRPQLDHHNLSTTSIGVNAGVTTNWNCLQIQLAL